MDLKASIGLDEMTIANKEFLAAYAYLFLVDPSRLYASGKQYIQYEKEEPGYGLGILKGYSRAFAPEQKNPMSHKAIQEIHKAVTAHLPEATPGKYKTACNNFSIYMDNEKTCTGSASWDGFLEFLDTSVSLPNSIHSISFACPKSDLRIALKESFELVKESGSLKVKTTHQDVLDAGYSFDFMFPIPKPLVYDPRRDNPRIKAAFYQSGPTANLKEINESKELFFINAINSMPADLVPPERFSQTLLETLDTIFDSYHEAIQKADGKDEKLTVIVSHVQRISQLHPFQDGNTRVCYILLNRLLKSENLNLTLLFNPNRLDCFSIEENVAFVKQGQDYCSRLLLNSQSNIFEDDFYLASALKAGLKKVKIGPTPLPADAAFTHFLSILENEQVFLKSQLSALSQAVAPMPFVGQYFNESAKQMFRYYLDDKHMLTAKVQFEDASESQQAEDILNARFPGLSFFFDQKQGKFELIVPGVNLPENAECLKKEMIRCGVMRPHY